MAGTLISNLSKVIEAGSKSGLSLLALGICLLAILALVFFRDAEEKVRILIYLVILTSFVGSAGAAYFSWLEIHTRGTERTDPIGNGRKSVQSVEPVSSLHDHTPTTNKGWVYYEVFNSGLTDRGKLAPADGSPMPLFSKIHTNLLLKADVVQRLRAQPTTASPTIDKIQSGDCVRVSSVGNTDHEYDTSSGGWLRVTRADCR